MSSFNRKPSLHHPRDFQSTLGFFEKKRTEQNELSKSLVSKFSPLKNSLAFSVATKNLKTQQTSNETASTSQNLDCVSEKHPVANNPLKLPDIRRLNLDEDVDNLVANDEQGDILDEEYNWEDQMIRVKRIDSDTGFNWRRKAVVKRNVTMPASKIERLKEITHSTWQNYVNNSPHYASIKKLSNKEIRLCERIYELMYSEKSYVDELKIYLNFSKSEKACRLSRNQHQKVFMNVDKLYGIHCRLSQKFSSIFTKDIYMTKIIQELRTHFTENKFEAYIEHIALQSERDAIVQSAGLSEIKARILTPMQRITRYPMMFASIVSEINEIKNQSSDTLIDLKAPPVHKESYFFRNDRATASLSMIKKPVIAISYEEASKCLKNAKNFANRCDDAVRMRNNLIMFNESLADPVPGLLVSTSRLALTHLSITAVSISSYELENIVCTLTIKCDTKSQKSSLTKNFYQILMSNDIVILAKEVNRQPLLNLVGFEEHQNTKYFLHDKIGLNGIIQFSGMSFLFQFNNREDKKEFQNALTLISKDSFEMEKRV